MHTYKAIQYGPSEPFVLEKDGRGTICPKTAFVMPQQSKSKIQGAPQMHMVPGQFPCNTSCPFATLDKQDRFEEVNNSAGSKSLGEQDRYCIRCERSCLEIWLDEVVPYKKPGNILMVK